MRKAERAKILAAVPARRRVEVLEADRDGSVLVLERRGNVVRSFNRTSRGGVRFSRAMSLEHARSNADHFVMLGSRPKYFIGRSAGRIRRFFLSYGKALAAVSQ